MPEVKNLGMTVARDHDVVSLEIAMHYAQLARFRQSSATWSKCLSRIVSSLFSR